MIKEHFWNDAIIPSCAFSAFWDGQRTFLSSVNENGGNNES